MKKLFNVAGPCNYQDHYMVPMVARHPEVEELIEQKQYFVIYAPRQTGKTTLVRELAQKINSEKQYYALYCSLESAQIFTDPKDSIPEILNNLEFAIRYSKIPNKENFGKNIDKSKITTLIKTTISDFCMAIDKPLVLLIDEIDSLEDRTLVGLLRQFRDGYITRDLVPFPQSIVLIGMRNIREYKSQIREGRDTLGTASPFNIIKRALTLDRFEYIDTENLYKQHTEETDQVFSKESIEKVYEQTNGQPWLVNAIANEIVEDILKKDFSITIQAEMVDQAIQNIIIRRDTHIDSLLDKLKENRVQRIIEPILLGKKEQIDILHDDAQYCLNLGLIRKDEEKGLIPANPNIRVLIRGIYEYGNKNGS